MMMQLLLPIVLQLAGVAVIIVEFIVPSFGILTAVSLAIFGFSLYWVFTHVSTAVGMGFVVFDVILIPILVIVGMRMLAASRVTLRTELDSKSGAVSQPPEWSAIMGKEGTSLTMLRPAGSAMIDGKKYDVVSRGEYIEKGVTVLVVAVDSNRVVVKRKE